MPAVSSTIPTSSVTDRECLEAWRRDQNAENLKPLIQRYGALVYSSACRRTGSEEDATEVTRAVFLVLARRARKLPKKTLLAGWLFKLTGIACRNRISLLRRIARWFRYKRRYVPKPDEPLWARVAPAIDRALQRLSAKRRNAVLLCAFLNHDATSAASILRTRPRRVEKRLGRGMKKLAKRLRTRRAPVDSAALASVCATEGCALAVPDDLALDILQSIEASRGRRPSPKIARRTLRSLGWARWRRRFVVGVVAWHVFLAIVGAIVWRIGAPTGHSQVISAFIVWWVRFDAMRTAEPARPWPTNGATRLEAGTVQSARDLYQPTNIWLAHLNFTPEQWKELEANYIGPLPNFFRRDGLVDLRNPRAQRSGVAGVFGYEFDWTRAGFEFAGVPFTNVAVRVKGNMGSLCTPKRSFKIDLNKVTKGQKLGGVDELTFNNLVWDYSFLSEALGYEFFRDAGVPASRTAFAWLSASVATRWERKPLGLYLMVESVGEEFAKEQFGSKRTPVFKPVTYKLFEYLGDNWSAYAAIYDLKTEATLEQQRRVIDFARLVSSASDAEFAAQVGDFLDVDEFARFLAVQVLLSHYDSILSLGQNFFMYLHPRSNKFGFIPWDLDSAWGHFWLAEKEEFERASIWHPWVGENRFIERVMAVEEFRRIYRGHLEDFLARVFVPERLHRRIDEMASVIRDPVSAESTFRLKKFEQAVGLKPLKASPGESKNGVNHPPHQLKPFIEGRAKSVRRQLDGQSKGVIVKTPKGK